MSMIKPLIKPYSEIVKTAARLFNISELDAEIEMDARLRKLKIPKIAVVIYVNWASHNALTAKEIAEEMGLTEAEVRLHLQTIKRKWKYLFYFGPRPRLAINFSDAAIIDIAWIDKELERLQNLEK